MRRRRSPARRAAEFLGAFAVLAAVALAAAILDEMAMRTVVGAPRAVDGDTLAIDGQRLRLAGIDAPEFDQTCARNGADYACGREAQHFLARLLRESAVSCRGNQKDRYGRLLVRCVSDKTDINAAMVRAGWAVSYGDYEGAERVARADGSGLWAGTFDRPAEWRAQRGALADLRPAGLMERLIDRMMRRVGLRSDEEAS